MKVVNWNVQWATPGSARSPCILERIQSHDPEVICLTETSKNLLGGCGYSIWPQPYSGGPVIQGRRKVLLWSRRPWRKIDWSGHPAMPPGRYVSGITQTSIGDVMVIGVCIPWHNANVNVGARDKGPWEEHSTYLSGLASILNRKAQCPVVLAGDFNQQIGQRNRPYPPLSNPVRDELQETMIAGQTPGLTIATAGLGMRGRRAIDHIAIGGDLSASSLTTIDNLDGDRRLSDHFGVVADLYTRDEPQNPSQKSEHYDNQKSSP